MQWASLENDILSIECVYYFLGYTNVLFIDPETKSVCLPYSITFLYGEKIILK